MDTIRLLVIVFTLNFLVDPSMASSHNTTINGDVHLLGDSYLRHSIPGLTLESNLLAFFSGNTTPVRFSSNRTNSSASFSFSTVNLGTFFISPENRNTGFPGGYLVLVLTENTFWKDPNDTLVSLDMDSLNWLETTDCMDAGIDLEIGIDYNRSQKYLKLVLLLLTPEMDLSCYFQEEETATQSYGTEYLNPQNVTHNTFDSRIKQSELCPKLIGIGLILVFFLFYISGACIPEWNLSIGPIQFQSKTQDFDDEETLDMNEKDVLLSKKRNSEFSLHYDLELQGEWINHLNTLFEKYIKRRKDLQVEDGDFLEFVPRESVLQILCVVRMILENKHFYSSYEHHLSSLLASTDADVVEACLQTLSAFLRKSNDSKPVDFPESLHELQPAEETVPDDTLSAAEDQSSQHESNSSMDCTSSTEDKTSSEQQLQMQSVVSTESKPGRSRWFTKAEMMEIGVHMMEDGDDDDDDDVATPGSNHGESSVPSWLTNVGYDISPYESDDGGYICQDDLLTLNAKYLPSWARKSAVAMALPLQQELDPETIFAAGTFCNMDTIFPSGNTDEVAGIQQQCNASKGSKVKALKAAKAAYLRQQEEEMRRKLHKQKYKNELAKAKKTNAKEEELYEKNKQEQLKKKVADENRRKKQRDQEERKQKALKRKQVVVPWKI